MGGSGLKTARRSEITSTVAGVSSNPERGLIDEIDSYLAPVLVGGLAMGQLAGLGPVLAGRVGSIADQQVRAAVLGRDQHRLMTGVQICAHAGRAQLPSPGMAVRITRKSAGWRRLGAAAPKQNARTC